MNQKNARRVSYRSMLILAIVVGAAGIAFQFIPGFEFFSFFLTIPVIGSLIGGSKGYEERERQQLEQSYKITFEWLLLILMAAYAFIEFSRWLLIIEGAAIFLNGHWPLFILSMMCLIMGITGFHRIRSYP